MTEKESLEEYLKELTASYVARGDSPWHARCLAEAQYHEDLLIFKQLEIAGAGLSWQGVLASEVLAEEYASIAQVLDAINESTAKALEPSPPFDGSSRRRRYWKKVQEV